MSVITSEKIFLDKKDEITFIVEKVLDAPKERVIVVIPQNSLILSSLVSIKILYRKVIESTRCVIVVTEDEKGISLVQKAGFVVVPKISNINEQLWEIANDRKDKDRYDLEQAQLKIQSEKEESAEEKVNEESIDHEEEKTEDENSEAENEGEKKRELEDEDKYTKPRRDAKLVSVGGIEIFAGGNIKKTKEDELIHDKIGGVNNSDMSEIDRLANLSETKEGFTGRDFTRTITPKKQGILSKLFHRKNKVKDPDERLDQAMAARNAMLKKRLLAIIAVGVLVGTVILAYFLVYRFNSVDVALQVKKEDVSAVDRVIGDTTLEKIDYESYSIPAITVKEENLSTSKTGEASGTAKRGTKAKGAVTIFNTTSNPITLAKGTKITSVATSRIYVLLEDVSIEASEVDTNGAIDAKYASDVNIEASDVGSEYNIADSEPKTKFTIEGYEQDKVYAQRFKAIEGGTSETYTIVSQENVDALKERIVPELKNEGLTKIKGFVPTGYLLLEESVTFEESKVKALPEVGQESTDKTFTLSVEAKISAFAVKTKDLEDVTSIILSNNGSGKTVSSIDEIKIANVQTTDAKVSFDVSFKGTVGGSFTEDDIKDTLKGKTMKEAREYLAGQEEVETYTISFSPSFLPNFLQFVPRDAERISVTLE